MGEQQHSYVSVRLDEMLEYGKTYEHFTDLLVDKVTPDYDPETEDPAEIQLHEYDMVGCDTPNVAIFKVVYTIQEDS